MDIHWHSDGHHLYATRHDVTVSVEAPIQGQYTDARLWLSLLRYAITVLESKLLAEEFRQDAARCS